MLPKITSTFHKLNPVEFLKSLSEHGYAANPSNVISCRFCFHIAIAYHITNYFSFISKYNKSQKAIKLLGLAKTLSQTDFFVASSRI